MKPYFLYRPIQRLLHRFNLHYMPPCYPEGDTLLWCRWCGIRDVYVSTEEAIPRISAAGSDVTANLPAPPLLKLGDLKYSGNTMRRKHRR